MSEFRALFIFFLFQIFYFKILKMDNQSQFSSTSRLSRTSKGKSKGRKQKGVTFVLHERSSRDPFAYQTNATPVLIRQHHKDETPNEIREKEMSMRKYLGIEFEDDHDYQKYLLVLGD